LYNEKIHEPVLQQNKPPTMLWDRVDSIGALRIEELDSDRLTVQASFHFSRE
jgi:hypothetical protein